VKILKFFHEDFRDFLRILHQFLSVGIARGAHAGCEGGWVRDPKVVLMAWKLRKWQKALQMANVDDVDGSMERISGEKV